MGSLTNLEIGEAITVRVYKIVPNAPIAWANTYELVSKLAVSDAEGAASTLMNLKNIIVAFERSILNAAYVLDRVICSTYVADGSPYNPFSFTSFSVNLPGQYVTPGNPLLPLQLCTLVKRIVAFGRLGNLLYRGIVAANDATITSSGTVINQNRLDQIQNALANFIGNLSVNGFELAMVRGQQTVETQTLRLVSSLNVKPDMRFKKLNNRYFDKLRNTN
jgi:hypothetical protein